MSSVAAMGVVVATYNRISNLRLLLTALQSQSTTDFHVVIADDGSTDGTRDVIEQWAQRDPWRGRLRWVGGGRNVVARRSRIRNIGVANLLPTTDSVLLLDSDVLLSPTAIETCSRLLMAQPDCMVFGMVEWLPPLDAEEINKLLEEGSFLRLRQQVPAKGQGRVNGTFVGPELRNSKLFETHHPVPLSGRQALFTNTAMKLSTFHRLHGFDERMEGYGFEDMEFGIRAEQAGLACIYSKEMLGLHVWHPKTSTPLNHLENQRNLDYLLRKHGWDEAYGPEIDWSVWWHYHASRGSRIVREQGCDWAINATATHRLQLPDETWLMRLGHVNAHQAVLQSSSIQLSDLTVAGIAMLNALDDSALTQQTAIYFDVTDIINFARRSTRLTGIQRVQLNIIQLLAQAHPGGVIRCVFFDRERDAFFDFDPAARPHDVEFSAEDLLMDLGLLQPSGRFPSKVQIKSYLGRGQSGKLMRIVKKVDVYLSALFLPQRLRKLGFVVRQERQRPIHSVVLQRVAELPVQSPLVHLGASWFFPQTWRFARQHRDRGGDVLQFIHDLIPVTHQRFMPSREPAQFQQWLNAVMEYASHITSNSRFTASEYVLYAASRGQRAVSDVTPLAHEFIGYARNADVPLPAELKELEGQRFVVTVGNIEVRKNGMALIRTWKRLINVLGEATPRLLFAGRYGRIGGPEIRAAIDADAQLARFVSVIESPSDQALAWLYRNCLFSAYPSFVEGWGLPVGESAWFGRVCVASSAASITEVCGDLMLYANPSDEEELFRLIHQLIVSPLERQQRETAIRNATLRTWSDVANDLYAVIESLPRREHQVRVAS